MKRLEGKVAVITGGTTGIGFAAAKLFRDEGARVIVTGQNPRTLEVAQSELGETVRVVSSNAGDATEIAALFEQVRRDFGGLDVLFLNAGVVRSESIADGDEATFDELFRLNVKGPWLALRAAIPSLRRGGSVILNASMSANIGMPGSSIYAASKAAVRSLARTGAAELAELGVRVNALSPGPTDSGIIEKMGRLDDETAAIKGSLSSRIPLKRLGTSEEIARVALFLASDDASFITGEEIVADGGMTRV